MFTGNLVYEDRPLVDAWVKAVIGGVLALTLVLGIVFFTLDPVAAYILLGVTAFDALIFYLVLPRRYQIYTDRLVVRLGRPLSLTVPFSEIKEIKRGASSRASGAAALRLVTSSKYVVEIVRRGDLRILISPAGRDLFVEQLDQAVKTSPEHELY